MIDFASSNKWLSCTLRIQLIMQMIIQAAWSDVSPFIVMGDINNEMVQQMEDAWQLCTLSDHDLSWPEILNAFVNKHEEFLDFLYTFLTQSCCSKIVKYLNRLPKLSAKISLVNKADNKTLPIFDAEQSLPKYITVTPEEKYYINIQLTKNKTSGDAFTPKFPRTKEEGWVIILGCNNRDNILCMKRLSSFKYTTSCKLDFDVHTMPGKD